MKCSLQNQNIFYNFFVVSTDRSIDASTSIYILLVKSEVTIWIFPPFISAIAFRLARVSCIRTLSGLQRKNSASSSLSSATARISGKEAPGPAPAAGATPCTARRSAPPAFPAWGRRPELLQIRVRQGRDVPVHHVLVPLEIADLALDSMNNIGRAWQAHQRVDFSAEAFHGVLYDVLAVLPAGDGAKSRRVHQPGVLLVQVLHKGPAVRVSRGTVNTITVDPSLFFPIIKRHGNPEMQPKILPFL